MEFTTTMMLKTFLNTNADHKCPAHFGWESTDAEIRFMEAYGLKAKDFIDIITQPVEEEPWGIAINHPINGWVNLTGWFHNLDDRSANAWWDGMFDIILGKNAKLMEEYTEALHEATDPYYIEMIEFIFTKALLAVTEHSVWVESGYFNIDPLVDKLKAEYNDMGDGEGNTYNIRYANVNGEMDYLITRDVLEILAHYGFTEAGLGINELRSLAREELKSCEDFEDYCGKYDVPTEGDEYEWSIKLGVLMDWLRNN